MAAESQRSEALKALEKVWELLHPHRRKNKESVSLPDEANQQTPTKSQEYGALFEAVQSSLDFVPEKFTRKHILTFLETNADSGLYFNSASISGCLHRLKRKGLITVITQGKGSMPSVYSKNIENETDKVQ